MAIGGCLKLSRPAKAVAVFAAALAVATTGTGLAEASITFGNTEYVIIDSVHVGNPVLSTYSDCEGYVDHGSPVVPVTVEATFITTNGEDPTGPYGGLEDWSGGLVGAPDDHFGGPQASDVTQFFHTRAYAQSQYFYGPGEYTFDAFAQDVGLAGGYTAVEKTFTLPGLPPGGGEAEVKCPFNGPFNTGDYLLGMAKSAAEDIADEIAKENLGVAAAKGAYDAVKKILYYNDLFNSTLENSVVDDPPDRNYQQLATAQPAPVLAPPADLSSDQQSAFVNLETALANDIGLTRALEAAENRSWGAENAGSRYWYRQQLQQQADLADQLASSVGDLNQLYADFQAAVSPDLPTVPVAVNDSLNYQVAVAKALPADEGDVLSQLGATTADENQIVQNVISLDADKLTTSDARNALFQQNDSSLAGPLHGMAQWARDALKAPPPVVADVSPRTLDEGGGTEVTITGSNLASVTGINFGPSTPMTGQATSFDCSDTQCTAYAPPGTGTVDVVAIGPGGPSATGPGDQVSYAVPPKPQVTHIYPSSGPTSGDTQVSIAGSGLAGGTVYFGPTQSVSTTCTDTLCTADTPTFAAPDTVDVQVVTGGGTSDTSDADKFTYTTGTSPTPSAPVITGVTPNKGSDLGGESVTITGSNFTRASAVDFGPYQDASSYQVVDDGTITAVVPPDYQAETVDIQVTGPGGTSSVSSADQFTYQKNKPTITSVSPASGPDTGGTTVTIHGSNLGYGDGSSIDIGNGYIADAVCSGNTCTGTTPPGEDGPANVTIYTDDGSDTLTGGFSYTKGPLPAITSVSPDSGVVAGGNDVVVSGTNLSAGQVSFGGNKADGTCTSTTCVVTAPQGDKGGQVDLQVTTNAGTSAITPADTYSYVHLAAPVVDSVDPSSGYLSGYDAVRITGTDLTDGVVKFGDTTADGNCSYSECDVRSPEATGQGPVVVTVATDSGTSSSSASASNEFTYKVPAITGISPSTGWTAGGTQLTITGTDFPGTTDEPATDVEVTFGSDTNSASATCTGTTCTVTTPKVADTTGAVDVQVRAEYGTQSPATAADKFTFFKRPAPTVTSVSPNSGSDIGGDQVTITGTDLDGGTVKFGTVAARNVTCGHTSCTATSPNLNSDGTVDVTVTTPAGTSATSSADQFTSAAPGAPSISSVDPSSGSIVGGTPVTISGQNLTGGTVTFGGKTASGITCYATSCTLTTPSQTATGSVPVVLTTHGLHSGGGTANASYSYVTPPTPTITGVSPASGPKSGGTPFTVTGTDFSAGSVKVGGTAATTVTCKPTQCTGVTPAGSAGPADVTVTTPGGTSAATNADTFNYSTVSIAEHAIPGITSGSGGGGIVRAPNGDIWFAVSNQDMIGRLSASDGTITTYSAAKPAGYTGALDPIGITVGPNGDIWYCERNTDLIVDIDNSGNQTPYQVPGSAGVPGDGIGDMRFLTAGPDGRIWFTLGHSSAIGALDPATGAVSEYRVPNPTVLPYNIVSGPDGRLWFTEVYGDDIGAITTSGKITEYPLPDKGPWAWGLTVGTDNRLWFGDTMARDIGAITTDGVATTYPVPSELDDPQGVIAGSDGRMWFTAPDHDTINALDPVTGAVTEYAMPPGYPAGEAPRYLAMGSDGTLWVTENQGKNIVSVSGIGNGSGPAVTAITPDHGAAGTSVTIGGSGFAGATAVKFGSVPATSYTVDDPTHITAIAPSGSGAVDIAVTTPQGTSTTSPADRFNYGGAISSKPKVDGISPDTGPIAGGTTVTITGVHMTGGTVTFGNTAATSVSCTDTACTATSPAGSAGPVDVTVTTGAGASASTDADQFVYQGPTPAAPTVTAVSPASGSDSGGTPVTISGTHLSGGTIQFGLESASDAQCSDTQCTVTTPAGGAGPVDVRVTTAGGTSPRGAAAQFTYVATTKRPVSIKVTASDPSFEYSSESEGFTADVSPAIAGDLQFEVDGTPVGNPVHVSSGDGYASSSYFSGPSSSSYFGVGNHTVTAVLTPADSAYYATSQGTTTFTVTKAATNVTLSTYTTSPSAGQMIYLYATVQPYAAAGTVQFEDGSTPLGDPVTVSYGSAHYYGTFSAGTHNLHAVFTPTDATSYSSSTGDLTLTAGSGGTSADPSAATISVPKTAKYGAKITASTTLTDTKTSSPIGGALVTLEQRPTPSAPWTSVGSATTSSTGAASVPFTAHANEQLQWVYVGDGTHQTANSAVASLTIPQGISIAASKTKVRHGTVFELYGTVQPGAAGQRVTLQLKTGKKWKTVTTAKLATQRLPNRKTALGYVFREKLAKHGKYSYRVEVGKTSTLAAGTSKTTTVSIT